VGYTFQRNICEHFIDQMGRLSDGQTVYVSIVLGRVPQIFTAIFAWELFSCVGNLILGIRFASKPSCDE
jgi:hypothetical protein